MRVFRIIAAISLCVFGLTACSSSTGSNVMNFDENLTSTDFNASENEATASESGSPEPVVTHLYSVEDGDKYGYVAAVSEDDQKRGKVAGDVVFFVYRGREGDKYKLDEVTADGAVIEDDECSQPCSAIKRYTYGGVKYMGFEPTSLAGAAFTDAFNGFLRPAPLPKPIAAPAEAAPNASASSDYPTDNADDSNAAEQ